MDSLQGRVALVTGGTGALGRAVVEAFARAGARVASTYIDDRELAECRERLGALAAAVSFRRADVTQAAEVEDLVRGVVADHGGIDIVANIVGGYTEALLEDTTEAGWDRMFNMNVKSAYLVTRAAWEALRRSRRGRVVCISASSALKGEASASAYSAAKAAVIAFVEAVAAEGREHGITANAIVPTIIDTPANRASMPDADFSQWTPPERIAAVITFLAGDAGGTVTAARVPV